MGDLLSLGFIGFFAEKAFRDGLLLKKDGRPAAPGLFGGLLQRSGIIMDYPAKSQPGGGSFQTLIQKAKHTHTMMSSSSVPETFKNTGGIRWIFKMGPKILQREPGLGDRVEGWFCRQGHELACLEPIA